MFDNYFKFKNVFLFLVLCLVHVWTGTATAEELYTNQNDKKPLLILISIDGFKPEYLTRGLTPVLNKLAQDGSIADGLIPPFPSLTFPSHFSQVTGLVPDHHGIVNNLMFDAEIPDQVFKLSSPEAVANPQWWKDGVPIWVTATQQGKICSTLFWPGSEAKNQGIQPQDWLPYDSKMNSEDRVKKLLEWLDRPDAMRADFATLYFSEVDSKGHEYGPRSDAVNSSIQNVDNALSSLVAGLSQLGLLEKTTFVITSDHGMAEVNEQNIIDIKRILKDYPQSVIKWLGPLAGLDINGLEPATVLKDLNNESHMQCWAKEKIPEKYHFGANKRIPQVICLAELGWTITDNPTKKPIPGQHGYDPYLTDMHGIFIASGYKIKKQHLEAFNNIDVYPLLMKLLHIEGGFNDADGHLANLIHD
jgi:ectonucleotide pyrophosphatase/phosphodiesterase family member 5